MTLELCDPPVTAHPSLEPVWQKIEADRKDADDGHDRLRKDYRALDDRLERLEHDHIALLRKVDRIESTPPNIEKMAWTTKQMIGIVSGFVAVVGVVSAETYALQLNISQLQNSINNTVTIQNIHNAEIDKQLTSALAESRLNGIKTDKVSEQLTSYLLQHTK